MCLVSRTVEVVRRIRIRKHRLMRGLLNDLKDREEEEMLQNDIIGINREQIASVVPRHKTNGKRVESKGRVHLQMI
tara:strand:- start:140 stop:367 length:228 start_codon:yes stop_codon:yes gene_type:complete